MEATIRVRQAVLALYRGDPAQQALANAWLNEFQRTPESWEISHALFRPDEEPEVLFFTSSLLLRKVRQEWTALDPTLRAQLRQAFTHMFQGAIAWGSVSAPVLRQLCFLQAATLAAHDVTSPLIDEVLGDASRLLQTAPFVGLELLCALAEEAIDLDRRRRSAMVQAMHPSLPRVLNTLGAFLTHPSVRSLPDTTAVVAVRAAHAWLRLSPPPSEWSEIGPTALQGRFSELFMALLAAALGDQTTDELIEAAVGCLIGLLSSSTYGSEEDSDAAPLSALTEALVNAGARLTTCSEAAALAVAQIGSAVAERWPEGAGGMLSGALPLAQVMLDCIDRRREWVIAESALDYFFSINTVPLAQRRPELGAPLFEALVVRLQRHVAYPTGFTWWNDPSDEGQCVDSDEFLRTREAIVPEILEEAQALMRQAYLRRVWEQLSAATCWQQAEVAVYLAGAVALRVRTRALAKLDPMRDPSGSEDAAKTRAAITALFQQLCSDAALQGAHPILTTTSCWCIEQYAAWFGQEPESPLDKALDTVLGVLTSETSTGAAVAAAAGAFLALCLRTGAQRLQDPSKVSQLQRRVHEALSRTQPNIAIRDQQRAVEGLAHLTAKMPGDIGEAAAAALVSPLVHQLSAAVGGATSRTAVEAAARSLQIIAAALKALLAGALSGVKSTQGSGGPAVHVLRAVEEPLRVVVLSESRQQEPEVLAAAVDVYKQAVCSARQRSLEVLPSVLPIVGAVFRSTAFPVCLDVLSEAIEIHFQNAEVVQGLVGAMLEACEVAFPLLVDKETVLGSRSTLAASMLGLGDNFAVYAPASLWTSPALPSMLGLAGFAASAREEEPVLRALSFLGHVISTQERVADDFTLGQVHNLEAIHTALALAGSSLTADLLHALCNTCPRSHMRKAADRLRALLTHPALATESREWFLAAAKDVAASSDGAVAPADCATFCRLALRENLRAPRMSSLFVDFGLMARGEEDADVLLAYEL